MNPVENLARKSWEAGARATRYRDRKYLVDHGYVALAAALDVLPIPTEEDIAEEARAMRAVTVNG